MFTEGSQDGIVRRVRAILLTQDGKLMFIKRIKPNGTPYWVAPGGGVEGSESLMATLERELYEELGATTFSVLREAFVLEHEKAGKQLEEHFYICKLLHYDLDLRCGPEFDDPSRGEFLPDVISIGKAALNDINIKTPELGEWLTQNTHLLRRLAR